MARALNQNNGNDINLLTRSLANITSRFQGRQQQLTDLNRQLAITLDAVNADGGRSLANLLTTAPPAFQAVRGALNDINGPLLTTDAAVRALQSRRPRPRRGHARRAGRAPRGPRAAAQDSGRLRGRRAGPRRALTPALRDLRPVVPPLREALGELPQPLQCLGIYDVGQLLNRFAIPIRAGDPQGNSVRFTLTPTERTLSVAPGPINALLSGVVSAITANSTPVNRPCPPMTRDGSADRVIPPPAPGYAGPADARVPASLPFPGPGSTASTTASPTAATTGGN